MNNFLELASTRRSIRKFENADISDVDIQYFVNAAVSAPSGCNSQCWRFVAIKDRDVINKIETVVIEKLESILEAKRDELSENYVSSKKKMMTFFSKAPVVFAVFMTESNYYDPMFISVLKEQGYDDDEIMKLFANYDILSIGAAIQNMLLAIHEKGYGACWMNEPAIAGEEIGRILGVQQGNKFMSLIPVGVPVYNPRNKEMKNMDEVLLII